MDNFKVNGAQQAKIIKIFKNAKQKLLKTNAAIWINKICRINKSTPQYIQIKTERNEQSKNTKLAKLYKLYLLHIIYINNGVYCRLQKLVNDSLSLAIDFKPGILCFLKAVHLFQNVSELFNLYINTFQGAIRYNITGCRISNHKTYNIFYEITNRCSYMQSILFHC